MQERLAVALSVVVPPGLSVCAGMPAREKNATIGAAIGGESGSVFSNGSALGTVGAASLSFK